MKKLLYITNIPTPYRQKRFNTMAEIMPKYGMELEVLYMAKIEPNRSWEIRKDTYKYNYRIFKGIHPTIGGMFAHLNPGLLIRLLKRDYDIAVIGGMASPTHLLAPFFIPNQVFKIMSVESNLFSVNKKNGLGAWIKKILLKKVNAYQVTGKPQEEYITYFYSGAFKKPIIKLPNLIDEDLFRDKVAELRKSKDVLRKELGIEFHTQLWILPARLISIKGIIPFIKLLKGINNIQVYLLGDGELKEEINRLVSNLSLPVKVIGFVQESEMIKYYAVADLFVLPSIQDPSPLSPIEACAAGLPLLVSSRIGNLEEVLEENQNGWCYDPLIEQDKGSNIIKFISSLSDNKLSEKGMISLKRYNELFNTKITIMNYAKNLTSICNSNA